MKKSVRQRRLEISAIYFVTALLFVSLAALGQRAAAANTTVKAESLYPSLCVENTPEVQELSQKTVYFTFDDGPSNNTEKILDMLAKEQIKATFFVCVQCSDNVDTKAVLRRILDEGHEIGLHSYTHDYNKIYRDLDGYLADLNKLNEYIIEATGYHASIVRFPGGSGTSKASRPLIKKIIAELDSRGYRFYDWDVVSGDQTSKVNSAEYLAQNIIKGAREANGRSRLIVLLHDSPKPKTSCKAVELAIPELREMGYTFDKLTSGVDPAKH